MAYLFVVKVPIQDGDIETDSDDSDSVSTEEESIVDNHAESVSQQNDTSVEQLPTSATDEELQQREETFVPITKARSSNDIMKDEVAIEMENLSLKRNNTIAVGTLEKIKKESRNVDFEDLKPKTKKETDKISNDKEKMSPEEVVPMLAAMDEKENCEELEEEVLERFLGENTLLEVVVAVLDEFGVSCTYEKTNKNKVFQIVFLVQGKERCEQVLDALGACSIGTRVDTSISVFPSSIYRSQTVEKSKKEEESEKEADVDEESDSKSQTFKKSIKARMIVTEVVNDVWDKAEFTFDFVMLCCLASMISGMGLIENSSVILVASMLVSPIMGPILAATFGFVIRNMSLMRMGISSGIRGLMLCVACGFVFGLIVGGVNIEGNLWGSTRQWPTYEMKSRGMLRSLWTGVLIAVPSGAGVALSILGGNTGSLVGVAISASLLPPAVNAGMLWAASIITAIVPPKYENNTVLNSTLESTVTLTNEIRYDGSLVCPRLEENEYMPIYSCNMAIESALIGTFSLLLTMLNISCIFILGIIVLKGLTQGFEWVHGDGQGFESFLPKETPRGTGEIPYGVQPVPVFPWVKEVVPKKHMSKDKVEFWSDDIKIARLSNKTSKGKESITLAQQAKEFLKEWRQKHGEDPNTTLQFKKICDEIIEDPCLQGMQNRYIFTNQVQQTLRPEFLKAMQRSKKRFQDDGYYDSNYPVYHTFHSNSSNSPIRKPPPVKSSVSVDDSAVGTKHLASIVKRYSVSKHDRAHSPRKHPGKKRFRFKVEKVPEKGESVTLDTLKSSTANSRTSMEANPSISEVSRL